MTAARPARAKGARYLGEVVALALLVLGAVGLSRSFSWVEGHVAPIWLPTGVSIAALLWRGRRLLPGVLLGTLAAGLLSGTQLPINAALSAAHALEAMAAATLLARLQFEGDLTRLRGVLVFVVACSAACAVSATLGVGILCLAGPHSLAGAWHMWHVWWAGHCIGGLVVGSFLLAWAPRVSPRLRFNPGEGAALFVALAATCWLAFSRVLVHSSPQPAGFLVFPLQIWAAVRLGTRGATGASLVALMAGVWTLTLILSGAPAHAVHEPLLLLQVFVMVLAVTGMVLAAAMEERARAEEQNRLLSSAIRASADGILIGETTRGDPKSKAQILFANDAHGRLFGVKSESLVGQPTAKVRRPALCEGLDQSVPRRLQDGFTETGELEVKVGGGARRIEWRASPVPDQDGVVRHFVSIQRDVTQRQAEGRALRWNEALLRTITAAGPSALFVFDERKGSVLYFNQRFIELWSLEDLKDRLRLGEVTAQEVLARHFALAGEADDLLRPMGGEPGEDEVALRDGRTLRRFATRITDAEGRYFGKLLVFEDVTLRKRAEADVVRSRERYRALVSSLPDTILRISAQGNLLDAFVPGNCCLFTPATAVIRRHLSEALPEEFASVLLDAATRALTGDGAQSCNERVRTLQGPLRYFEARVVKSGPDEVLAILRDVTDHREMQAKLLLSDRMASVGTLAAGVAHEINNPLSYVMANDALLLENLTVLSRERPSARLDECLELLRESAEGAERVRLIVRDLKTFSRNDEERVDQVDLRHVVDRAVALAWSSIKHKARLVKQYGVVPRLAANEARLGQVFLNLIVNAAQAIPDGDAEGNAITIKTRAERGCAVVEVHDTGCGIAQENLGRIFDPFFTTKPVGVGTGLGLAICHQIVVAQGGEIEVETAPGKGTCIRVRLRIGAATLAPERPAARSLEAPAAPRRRSVLIVDDEAMVARSVTRVLSGEHEVQAASSGREVMRLLDEGKHYDVILCDLMMPEVSGMELYEQLGRLRPELATRMIFLTGGAFTQSARTFLETVENPRLEKPFDLEELKRVVRSVAAAR